MTHRNVSRIAVFASGSGSNAENIVNYFRQEDSRAEVALIVCNRAEAGVIARAERLGVECVVIPRPEWTEADTVIQLLADRGIDYIVLAGFLLMVPPALTARYAGRMLNIHPSLLPSYGGKGMYGRKVHEAVVAAGETVTGITIHRVTERYDEGAPVFQATVEVSPADTPETVEAKIHTLEKQHFPRVIAETFLGKQ